MPAGYFLKSPLPSPRRWSPSRSSSQAKRFILFKKNNVPHNHEKDDDRSSTAFCQNSTSSVTSASEVVTAEEEEALHPNNKRDDDNDTSREKCTQQQQQLSYKIDTYNLKRGKEEDGSSSSSTITTEVDDDYDAKSTTCNVGSIIGNDYIKTHLGTTFATKKVNYRQQQQQQQNCQNRPAYPMLVPFTPPNNSSINNNPSSSSGNSPTNHNEFELFSIQIEMAKSAFLKSPWSHERWMDLVHSFRMENERRNNDNNNNTRMRCDGHDFHDDHDHDAITESSSSSGRISRIGREEENITNEFRSSSPSSSPSSSTWADFGRVVMMGANNKTHARGWSCSGAPIATTSVIEVDDGLDKDVKINSALARPGNSLASTSFPVKEGSTCRGGGDSIVESSCVEFGPDALSMESLEGVSNISHNVKHGDEKGTPPNSATTHAEAMASYAHSSFSEFDPDSSSMESQTVTDGGGIGKSIQNTITRTEASRASYAHSTFSEFDPDSLSTGSQTVTDGEDLDKGMPNSATRMETTTASYAHSSFSEFYPDSLSMERDDVPPTTRVEDEDAKGGSTPGGPIKLPNWLPRKSVMLPPRPKPSACIPKEAQRWKMESKTPSMSRVEDGIAKEDSIPVAKPKSTKLTPRKATIISLPSKSKEARDLSNSDMMRTVEDTSASYAHSTFSEFDPDSLSMESDVPPPNSRAEDEDAKGDIIPREPPKLPNWPPRTSVMMLPPKPKPRARIPKEARRWEMERKVTTISRGEDKDAKGDSTPSKKSQPKFTKPTLRKATISSPTSKSKEAGAHHVLNEVQHWEERIGQFDQRYVNIVAAALDDAQGVAWKVGQIVEVVPNSQEEKLYVV